MCSICKKLKSNKIDNKEALKLLGEKLEYSKKFDPEMVDHLWHAVNKILEAEVPFNAEDAAMAKLYRAEVDAD